MFEVVMPSAAATAGLVPTASTSSACGAEKGTSMVCRGEERGSNDEHFIRGHILINTSCEKMF